MDNESFPIRFTDRWSSLFLWRKLTTFSRVKIPTKSNQIGNDSTNYFELIKEFHLGIQLFSEKPHCKIIKTKAVVTKGAAGY